MVDSRYHYRGTGEIGNPDSTITETVEMRIRPSSGTDEVMFELRSEQFPAGRIALTPAQVAHLRDALDTVREDPTTAGGEGRPVVVHPDGRTDDDTWESLR